MHRRSTALPRGVEAPARARRLCATACADWELDALTDVCQLLVSELVTNAVVHGAGVVRLELRTEGGSLHVAVCQGVRVPDGLPEATMSGPDAVRGRGLAIVDQLAAQWGADTDESGTTVWFDLLPPHDGGVDGVD